MKTARWTDDKYINYALSEIKERYEVLERDKLTEEAFEQGKLEGLKKGELKGKIKQEIKQVKNYKKMENDGLDVSKYYDKIEHKDQIMSYFDKHPNDLEISDNESQILGDMNIEL